MRVLNGVLSVAFLALVAVAIVVILAISARRRRDRTTAFKGYQRAAGPAGGGRRWPCPLCGELLGHGERIRSTIRLSPRYGRIMEIAGCPHCLPPLSRRRSCPACKADLGPSDVLIARIFDLSRESAKPHVHVLGCSRCRGDTRTVVV